MSTPDLREFLSAYLVEVEEHLLIANTQLLAVEASQRSGVPHPRAVRETFRSLHTIKGLSAMVGIEPIVAITHRMEVFVRDADRSATELPPRAIDALLEGVRAVENRVAALGRGEAVAEPSAELLRRLDSLGLAAPQAALAPVLELNLDEALLAKLAPFEAEQLLRGAREGKKAIRGDFFPSPQLAERGLTINSVRERLARHGEVVRVLPRAVPVSEQAPGGLGFVVLVLTSESESIIADDLGVDPAELTSLVDSGVAAVPEPAASLGPTASELLDFDERSADLGFAEKRKGIVRVDVTRLDDAMEGLSGLTVSRFRLTRAVSSLRERGVNVRELSEIMADNARQLRDLRAALVRVRMVPVSELLERIPLLVRGLCRATNRLVHLDMAGGDAELDKSVSERLFPVIVHLVRNAVDHAIETPDERVRRGKPEEGQVRIACSPRANTQLEFVISDDGRGIDRAAVARKAGRPVPESDAEMLALLCMPGLSTRDVVTTTSGRGMGMEIVKRTIVDELGGELELSSEFGKGTTFTLRVPLTVSIVDAFSFECGDQRFVVPVSMVDEIVELDPQGAVDVPNRDDGSPQVSIISRRGVAMPLLQLAEVFRLREGATKASKAIIVRRGGAPVAFAVDRMLGQQEVVIRPMDDVLVRAPGISGATDLGDGHPTLVVDLVALSVSLAARALPSHRGAPS